MSQQEKSHAQAALAQEAYDKVQQNAFGGGSGGIGVSGLGGERLIRRPEVEARTGLSRSTIYEWMKHGKFPQPVKLGERLVAWRESDIIAWLESRETRSA